MRVDRSHGVLDAFDHELRVALRASHHVHFHAEDLVHARVDARRRRLIHGALMHVAGHADDREMVRIAERDRLADRAPVREIFLRERLVHHQHDGSAHPILLRQVAAGDQRNPHGAEEAVAREHQGRSRQLAVGARREARWHEPNRFAVAAEGQVANGAGGDHTRYGPHVVQHVAIRAIAAGV